MKSYGDSYESDLDGHFIADSATRWPSPRKEVASYLDQAAETDTSKAYGFSPALIGKFRSRLDSEPTAGLCAPVDFAALQKVFLSEVAAQGPEVDKKIAAWISGLKAENKNSFIRIVVPTTDIERYRAQLRVELGGKVVGKYWGSLTELREACSLKSLELLAVFAGRPSSSKPTAGRG